MKTLHLVLKSKWYDMIDRGEKKEEYRENTSYWMKRIGKIHDVVCFHRGWEKSKGCCLEYWAADIYKKTLL